MGLILTLTAVVLCIVVAVIFLSRVAVWRTPVHLMPFEYQKTTDDRSSSYIQFQSYLKNARKSSSKHGNHFGLRDEVVLAHFDVLEVMGVKPHLCKAIAVVAACHPQEPPVYLSDRETKLLVKSGALEPDLLQKVETALEAAATHGAATKDLVWVCCAWIALKSTTTHDLQVQTQAYPNVVKFWREQLIKVDLARVYDKWPIFGLQQCTYAHSKRSERLMKLTARHARRLQGVMRPPKREMAVSIDNHKVRMVSFPIDLLEWNALIGERLVLLKKQQSMGMPPVQVAVLNEYNGRCAAGYDFEDKPLLMLETVAPEELVVPIALPRVESNRNYPGDGFNVSFHCHELLVKSCTLVYTQLEQLRELCVALLQEVGGQTRTAIESADLAIILQARAQPISANAGRSRRYTDTGFLSVLGGPHCEFEFHRGHSSQTVQTDSHGFCIVAGELLGMLTYYSSVRVVAGLTTHSCAQDTEMTWVSVQPDSTFSIRGFKVKTIQKNIQSGRPYMSSPW